MTTTTPPARLYIGDVVHKRLRPRPHALSYRVFSLLLDVDRIDEAAASCRLFARNRFAPVSFYDADHGPGEPGPIGAHARGILADAGFGPEAVRRIELLSYPRIFGYVFNPLSVYFAYDAADRLTALVYEVNNTFSERIAYVVPAGSPEAGVYAQSCAKEMFVSPFASGAGRYGFRVAPPGDRVLVAVSFRDADGPLLKTHFKAEARPLDDMQLARQLVRRPLMTMSVMAAIHYEALKLWLKGVPLVRGHVSPRYSVSHARQEAGPA